MPALTDRRLDPATDTVRGILCAERHFNHPSWRHCHACGAALFTRGAHQAVGPRPVVGMLIRDDGLRIAVSEPFLIVLREAGQAPTCVPWRDRGKSVLRIRVYFAGWQPLLVAESPGARLLGAGSGPSPLTPAVPVPLCGGRRIRVGRGSFTYESLVSSPESPAPRAISATGGRHRARRSRLPDPAIFPAIFPRRSPA